MNYQIIHVMDEYAPEMDRLLFYLPLAGSAFKKIYFDDILDRTVSRFVPADDLVVPYNATDLASSSRVTHVTRLSMNDIRKFQAGGFYRDIELKPYEADDELRNKERELSGIEKTTGDMDCTLLEVHTDLDLPGVEQRNPMDNEETGIQLPYIITIDEGSSKILAIRRNWTRMYRGSMYFGRTSVTVAAMAAVDMALWDLAGKHYDAPIHQLLGGKQHDEIRAYASILFGADGNETARL